MVHKQFYCPDCGGSDGHRSRPRNAAEKYILPIFLLMPFRCNDCYRRAYVSVFTRTGSANPAGDVHSKAA
jgi:hypothetical protein